MFPQSDKSWRDYKSLNRNCSDQPTLAGRAIPSCLLTGYLVSGLDLRDTPSVVNMTVQALHHIYLGKLNFSWICKQFALSLPLAIDTLLHLDNKISCITTE